MIMTSNSDSTTIPMPFSSSDASTSINSNNSTNPTGSSSESSSSILIQDENRQYDESIQHHSSYKSKQNITVDFDTNPFIRVFAATGAAMITSCVATPFDVIKTRMQYHHGSQYRGIWHSANYIIASRGISSLWTGLQPALISQVPATGLYYSGYEYFRNYLLTHGYSATTAPLFAGAVSRLFVTTLTSPFEYIRTAMQAQEASHSMMQIFRYSVQTYGFSRLWAGLGITMLRDAPFSAFYWFSYEHIKQHILGDNDDAHNTPISVHFISGAMAGMAAAALTNPLDVVKTRIQGNINDRVKLGDACRAVWEQKALFDGIGPRVIKVAPACAIMISSYEMLKHFCRSKSPSPPREFVS
mmetsp:Transcript_4486/g.16954  ORF Transcript_4486/g.16954 Transcript_4486/m.16954 type:complete len:357 (-) Transcript_4486:331-1401(-)